jgi:hypothetical protein
MLAKDIPIAWSLYEAPNVGTFHRSMSMTDRKGVADGDRLRRVVGRNGCVNVTNVAEYETK